CRILCYLHALYRRAAPLWSLSSFPTRRSSDLAFFQRLQRDPLLALQILALAAMAVALARPAVTVMGQGARKVVVVMDTSASMKARDAGGTRFAAARAQAASPVSGLGEGAEVMVLESGVQLNVLAPV